MRVHQRVRQRVEGTTERPRLCVYRSLGHIYAQVIDDRAGKTLVSASSVDKETKNKYHGRVKALADAAREAGLQF